jgi:hypothetical protein
VSLMTKATVSKGSEQVRAQAVKAQAQARLMRAQAVKAQQQARQTAAQVAPLAASARITAAERLHSARAWTAPRLERSGVALQERIAPSVSAMLTRAAHRIEPKQARKRRRWPFLAVGMILAGAATAGAAVLRGRLSQGSQAQEGDPSEQPEAGEAPQQADSTAADANGRVRTH